MNHGICDYRQTIKVIIYNDNNIIERLNFLRRLKSNFWLCSVYNDLHSLLHVALIFMNINNFSFSSYVHAFWDIFG